MNHNGTQPPQSRPGTQQPQPAQPAQPTQQQGLDLSAVRHPRKGEGAGKGATTSAKMAPATQPDPNAVEVPDLVFDVTEQTFDAVVQLATQVPVVIDLWAEWCGPCKQLSPVIEKVTRDLGGQVVLGKIDIDANPRLQQAFGVQSIPTVIALVKGQPVPLFQGATPEPQVREVFTQLITAATQAGVNKRAVPAGTTPEPAGPKYPEALAALEAGNLDAAAEVYQTALANSPADVEAKQGFARVELLSRTRDADVTAIRERAAANPADVTAALECADVDVAGGHVDDAFARLITTVTRTTGEERERVCLRLLELFEAVGAEDPRVVKARGKLMRALF